MEYQFNRKIAQSDGRDGWKLRVWHRKGKGKICDNNVEIYFDDESLEINGVNANLNEWRAILLPLLGSEAPR
ncbi:MAG: hypothetical protein QMD78_05250 [Methanocellales archaeon]|nr:hypothetical protein [Methanocellales archaeon]